MSDKWEPKPRRVVAALPGDGWKVQALSDHLQPVIAWLIYDDGNIEAASVDENGKKRNWKLEDRKVTLIPQANEEVA